MNRKKFPKYWPQAKRHLSRNDRTLALIIKRYPDEGLTRRNEPFATLCQSIIGQQISTKAASAIWGRLRKSLDGRVTPSRMLNAGELEGVGLSQQKKRYLFSLAEFADAKPRGYLTRSPASSLEKELLELPGIGPWTWEMFAIFSRLDPDIFPIGDLGLVRSIQKLYPKAQKKNQILALAEGWRPYRTAAVWYLWRDRDEETVGY